MSQESPKTIGGTIMKFEDRLTEAYNKKVSKPKDSKVVEEQVQVKKTHHYLFQSFKITGIVTASVVGFLILAAAGFIVINSLRIEEAGVKSIKKARFTIYDTNLVKNDTFEALNSITYSEKQEFYQINEGFKHNLNSFAANSFMAFDKGANLAYSPLMLYSHLDLISLAVSDDETKAQFDEALLTNDQNLRKNNLYASLRNNFFVNQELKSTVQTKNAVFIERNLGYNQDFVNGLSERNAEAYLLNFQNDNDVNNIIKWANQSVNEDGFLNKNDLKIQDDSALLFLSSLYFDNAWQSKYKTEDTHKDNFYLSNDEIVKTNFMNHAYYGEVYEYDKYVSVTDYYNSSYSIQYYVPKDIKDNIFDLLPNNFLTETKEVDRAMISLSLPKFQITSSCNLEGVVNSLGITNPYVKKSNHLRNAFAHPEDIMWSYLTYTKQKTSVSFSEDGTVIKSIIMSMGAAGAAAPGRNGYHIELNQPFVYCIKDSQGLPLLLGTIVNPIN